MGGCRPLQGTGAHGPGLLPVPGSTGPDAPDIPSERRSCRGGWCDLLLQPLSSVRPAADAHRSPRTSTIGEGPLGPKQQPLCPRPMSPGMHWRGGGVTVTPPTPPGRQAYATVSLTPSASFNGICNRQ